jgi:acyl-coenzyme A thioesterase PaaI-like protein
MNSEAPFSLMSEDTPKTSDGGLDLPGCTPVDPFPPAAGTGGYVSGEPEGTRLRIRFFYRRADQTLVASVWFGPDTAGPPGHAHGGSVAAALDEAMGAAAWHAGYPVVAARLTIDFRDMVPLGSRNTIEARVEQVNGRKVETRGRLLDPDSRVLAEATGLFIILEREQLARLAAQKS